LSNSGSLQRRCRTFSLIEDMKSIRFDWQDKREDLKWSHKRFMHHLGSSKAFRRWPPSGLFAARTGQSFTNHSARRWFPLESPDLLSWMPPGKNEQGLRTPQTGVGSNPRWMPYLQEPQHTTLLGTLPDRQGSMIKNGENDVHSLIEDTESKAQSNRQVLVVSHKKIEHLLKGLETNFELTLPTGGHLTAATSGETATWSSSSASSLCRPTGLPTPTSA